MFQSLPAPPPPCSFLEVGAQQKKVGKVNPPFPREGQVQAVSVTVDEHLKKVDDWGSGREGGYKHM